MSFTQAMQAGQSPQPGGAPAPGGGAPDQGAVLVQHITQLAQGAAAACGQLVQTLQKLPGVDQGQLEAAAAHLREALMGVVQTVRQVKPPQAGQAPGQPPQ